MTGDLLRQKLLRGERVYGTHVIGMGNPIKARFASELELDFIFICTEHLPVDRTEVSLMCQYWSARGIAPIVRIPYPCPNLASMYIDGGAQGIVIPYVENVDEVRQVAGALRYKPLKGEFLQDIIAGKRRPTEKLADYLERYNRGMLFLIGIESVAAVERLEQLMTVDGVDGVFIGPHDLSCSMEIPEEYENPLFINAVLDIIKRCKKINKPVGIHMDLMLPRARPFLDAGLNFLLHLTDVMKMRQIMTSDLAALRSLRGDSYSRDSVPADQAVSCMKQK